MTRAPFIFLMLLTVLCFSAASLESLLALDGNVADLANRFLPPGGKHLLGTDELGRDVFIRLLYGGQVSLIVGIAAALISCTIGTTIGMIAGYLGGKWDDSLMRLTDLLIALPALPLLIVLSAIDLEKLGFAQNNAQASLYKLVLLISLLGWTTIARLARARTLTIKEMDYVLAARALGLRKVTILWRHILPNILDTVIVAAALSVGNVILMESVLSFLGLGIQPPLPSWGNMLSNAGETMWEHGQMTFYPGFMIFMTVLCCNYIGDRLQAARDPKESRA